MSRDAGLAGVADSVAVRRNGGGYETFGGQAGLPEDRAALLNAVGPARGGDLLLLLKSGHYLGNTAPQGAPHGSIHTPDRTVPLFVALGGVNAGRSSAPISTTDIARIVAAYLGFTME